MHRNGPVLWWPPPPQKKKKKKNIHKIFIPPKYFPKNIHFMKTPKILKLKKINPPKTDQVYVYMKTPEHPHPTTHTYTPGIKMFPIFDCRYLLGESNYKW